MLRWTFATALLVIVAGSASAQDAPTPQPNDLAATMPAQGGDPLPASECEAAVASDVADVANVLHVLPDMKPSQAEQVQAFRKMATILDRAIRVCSPIDYSLPPPP